MTDRPSTAANPTTSRPTSRRGFTLVELLVVIGILVLVTGLVVGGFAAVGTGAQNRQTRAFMQTADALLTNYEAVQGQDKLLGRMNARLENRGDYAVVVTSFGGEMQFVLQDASPTDDVVDPSVLDDALVNVDGPARFTNAAVVATQEALRLMARAGDNEQLLANLPSQALLPFPAAAPAGSVEDGERIFVAGDPGGQAQPLLADGFGNPMILVPPGGLRNLTLSAHEDEAHVVTSRGIVEPDASSPGGLRLFWASAGADGNFATHDDNVYSFEAE